MISKLTSLIQERHYCSEKHRQATAVSTGAMTGRLPKCSECGRTLQTNQFSHEFRTHTNTSLLPPAIYRSWKTIESAIKSSQNLIENVYKQQ